MMSELTSKALIFARTVADSAIDLLLPAAIYLLLTPTHLSAIVRLTIGGYFVAAKASAGYLGDTDASARSTVFVSTFAIGVVIAAVATAITLGVRFLGWSEAAAIGV